IPWQAYAPNNPTEKDRPAAETMKNVVVNAAILRAQKQYESILQKIATIKNPACDVCVALTNYKLYVKPITDANLSAFNGDKIQFTDLRLDEIDNDGIYKILIGEGDFATGMSFNVVQYLDYKKRYDQLPPNSPEAIALNVIISQQLGIINQNWVNIDTIRKTLPKPANPIVLETAQSEYSCG